MLQLVGGLVLLIVLVGVLRWLATASPASLATALRGAIFAAVALGIAGVLLFLVLRLPQFLFSLIALAAPALVWWFRQRRASGKLGGGWSTPSGTQSTGVETGWLRMSLDHDSGAMDGVILRGRWIGRTLSALSEAELFDLLDDCAGDPQSVRVLEAYLDRRLDATWRDRRPAYEEPPPRNQRRSDAMSRDEACAVLGVTPDASEEEIKAAHRRLMRKVHPDQGGSDELASRVNRARAVLLG
ncbi:MAG: DnaJ domain-containing protein [Alphaproteobacteria bacterium]|nr:DnaJ domain-containing protein [Alphaproteobacteria bacterium]MCW5739369.1 DnaJ domain-containing protein [Alphaproteobacteria bacterium]